MLLVAELPARHPRGTQHKITGIVILHLPAPHCFEILERELKPVLKKRELQVLIIELFLGVCLVPFVDRLHQ